jgi:hypothetical protein
MISWRRRKANVVWRLDTTAQKVTRSLYWDDWGTSRCERTHHIVFETRNIRLFYFNVNKTIRVTKRSQESSFVFYTTDACIFLSPFCSHLSWPLHAIMALSATVV